MVDYAKPTPALPDSCTQLASRIVEETSAAVDAASVIDLRDEHGRLPPLNQLTINEYLPGQGIASHTGEPPFLSLFFIFNVTE